MNYEITGIVHAIHDTQTFASGFSKREFVVETTAEKYPQQIKLEAVKDTCDILDLYRDGDPITVSFNLRGNEYNGKHYVNLQAWKFDRGSSGTTSKRSESAPPATQRQQPPIAAMNDDLDEDDDIPF
jgi:hypothetical protein